MERRPLQWADCLVLGRVKFEKYFNHKVTVGSVAKVQEMEYYDGIHEQDKMDRIMHDCKDCGCVENRADNRERQADNGNSGSEEEKERGERQEVKSV